MEGSRPPTPGTRVSDYDYELPSDRIARYPAQRRDESRLLVVDRKDGSLRHLAFRDLVSLVSPGDLLVVNESKVLPVRLLGQKPTGAPAEVFLLRPHEPGSGLYGGPGPGLSGGPGRGFSEKPGLRVAGRPVLGQGRSSGEQSREPGNSRMDTELWEALVRPGGKLKPGRTVEVSSELVVEVLDSIPGGGRLVRLRTSLPVHAALQRYGHVPLPPYIDRPDEDLDRERYQTVYARNPGSVAAPTAGLHFTEELLDELGLRGVQIRKVTLHVGVGTFRPIEVEDPSDHAMHTESFHIPASTADAVQRCKISRGRVWAVGTTVVRTLESAVGEGGRLRPGPGETNLFIRPPYRFKVVDRLITNFHLPRSTLMMLVGAFAGYQETRRAYHEAIQQGYRFYSYGDAMAVL